MYLKKRKKKIVYLSTLSYDMEMKKKSLKVYLPTLFYDMEMRNDKLKANTFGKMQEFYNTKLLLINVSQNWGLSIVN